MFAGAVGAYAAGRVRRGAPLHVSAAVWDSDGVKRRMLLDAVEALRDKLEKKEIGIYITHTCSLHLFKDPSICDNLTKLFFIVLHIPSSF